MFNFSDAQQQPKLNLDPKTGLPITYVAKKQ
jgi:hypothetical protein